jgi:hypothetical protein
MRQPDNLPAFCRAHRNGRPFKKHEGLMKAEPGKPSRSASSGRRSNLTAGSAGTCRAPARGLLTWMPCAAARIQPACRTVGHLGGVPFRLFGDRERPVFRAEGAIGRWRPPQPCRRRGSGSPSCARGVLRTPWPVKWTPAEPAAGFTPAGTRIPGLRFTDERVQALLSALCAFRLLPNGFTNRDLRTHLAPLPGRRYEDMTSGQITYDLRRLRVHGLIERIPRTHRYQITGSGHSHALFLTRLHARFLRPGLAELTGHPPPVPASLRTADRAYRDAINGLTRRAGLAA